MIKIKYILLLIMLLTPNLSFGFIDDEIINEVNTNDLSYNFRESMLIDIKGIEYNNNISRVIITGNDIKEAAALANIAYQFGNFAVASIEEDNIPLLKAKGFNIIRDQELEFLMPDVSRLQEITRADLAISNGFDGSNTTIAIVDTGTDFSNIDIMDSIARDDDNKPIMLDADAQGIVLTRTKFIAKFDNGRIVNNTDNIHDDYTSDVYVNSNGVFLRAIRDNNTKFQIYNPLYPLLSPLVFNATANGDWKIGNSDEDYIRSASGIYRMGFIIEVQFHLGKFGLIIVPVLVVDSNEPNVYDTIIADMSDAWTDFAIFELGRRDLEFDFDFTDEVPRVIGDGNEVLTYDADNDNSADITAGVLGARVVDLWGAINNKGVFDSRTGLTNATLLEPMDANGTYFGIMYDYFGHGTATASTITSKGINSYDIYNNATKYKINGIAPNAKIIAVKALWFGDTPYSWLWASGFELINGTWQYTGKHKADVINNSWSIPVFTLLDSLPGYDPVSILADILSTPRSLSEDYPGTLIVTSAGNSGYGHGTISSPAASPLSLTVGASTNNVFVGYGFTKGQPRFGVSSSYYNDVAEFSSRGPLANGYVKPEILATGAYAFVPMLVNVKHANSEPIWLFGGTSMAAPVVAGASAIVIQALKEQGIEPDPQLVKNILMASAKDTFNEPFAQGSGALDLTNALRYINGEDSFLVYTNATSTTILDMIDYGDYKHRGLLYNLSSFPSTNWYAGFIERNSSREATFYVHNPSDSILHLTIKPTTLDLIKRIDIDGSTEVRRVDPALNATDAFAPNYIRVNKTDIPKDTELMVIKLRFPFETFMNMSDIYAHNLRISSLYLYEWLDANNDNEIWYNETRLVNRGGAYGTIQDISIADPLKRIDNEIVVGVYPVPKIISFWSGIRDINATSMNYTLTIDFYKKSRWDLISSSNEMLIKPNGVSSFNAKISIPNDAPFGVYQGYLTVKSSKQSINIPVSFSVPANIEKNDLLLIANNVSNTVFYEPSSLIGSFDMSSRFNSGEWKFYHLNVTDPSINVISAKIVWENDLTSISAFAIDPNGKIITSSVPAGVFKAFANWGSNDWLGRGRLGSGAYYPAANFGNNTTVFYIPVNGTGIYTLMLHNTLFHAKNLTEPFSIELKASTILPDVNAPIISFDMPKYLKGITSLPLTIHDPNIDEVRYRIDGEEYKLEGNEIILDTRLLGDGLHNIQIDAIDSVGNSMTKSFTFIVDNKKPEIILDTADIISNITSINVNVIEPNLANLTIELPDGSIVREQEFNFDASLLEDGEHEIKVIAEDLAGNILILRKVIEVDNTPPVIDLTTSSTNNVYGSIDIFYNVTDNNLASIKLLLDDTIIGIDDNGRYTLDTTSLKDGEHEIKVIAEDLAGNSASNSMIISTINQKILAENSMNTGILIGIGIGAVILASILIPLYIKKR